MMTDKPQTTTGRFEVKIGAPVYVRGHGGGVVEGIDTAGDWVVRISRPDYPPDGERIIHMRDNPNMICLTMTDDLYREMGFTRTASGWMKEQTP